MNIKDPLVEPEENYAYKRRFKHTTRFMVYPGGDVLVIGEEAPFEKLVEKHYCKIFDHTDFDLNWVWSVSEVYDTILCFQVVEHLLNPLLFLDRCHKALKDNGILYISYPTHATKWFWSSGHWHEMDKSRFHYLVKQAGFKVVKYESHIMWRKIRGFRSILRNTPLGWCKHHYYKLKKE